MEVLLATFSALFSVVNPFGATPLFIALTTDLDKKTRNDQALKASIYMIGILVVFFFAGTFILEFFGIRIEDIRIAGGILIVRSAFQLLNPASYKGKPIAKEVEQEGMEKADISFTPMAMPMLSGPGSIAVTIGFFDKARGFMEYLSMILAIVLVAFLSYLVLRSAQKLNKFLGKGGMAALSRMMGFIILSIGISMILNGILPLIDNILKN
ncbi:MAG: MarC family NAAT transporter [Bacteroidota bacterium]|jgi:multiple antibiotic resistance protein|nr:MarC family NAAT transporter [Bacteroidota bacterium]